MEDPESEWIIQKYSCSNKDDEHVPATMIRWMLNKGCGIGKKIIITGFAISSAPLVLPPLVFVSAMGVAVSVPFGFLFASYACTNKLMTMLLPIVPPVPSPLLLEYRHHHHHHHTDDEFEQEIDEKLFLHPDAVVADDYDHEGDGDFDEKGYSTDKDDNFEQEMDQGVDIVLDLHLDDGGGDYSQEGQILIMDGVDVKSYCNDEFGDENEMEDDMFRREIVPEEDERGEMEDMRQEMEMRLSFDDAGDDRGYEEDSGEYLEGDDTSLGEEQIKGMEPFDESRISDLNEGNEGNTELLEELANEKTANTVKDDHVVGESPSGVICGDVKDVGQSASNVVLGDVKHVDESASNVVFGVVKDVEESASNVVFGNVKDIDGSATNVLSGDVNDVGENAYIVVSGGVEDVDAYVSKASNVVSRDIEYVDVHVSNVVSGDVYDGGVSASNVVAGDVEDVDAYASNVVSGDVEDVDAYISHVVSGDIYDVGESASRVVFGDAEDVGESASSAVYRDAEDVSESASSVVFGDAEDVDVSASAAVFADIKDVGESASNAVSKDVEDVGESASTVVSKDGDDVGEMAPNVVFGDVNDVGTAKTVTVIEIGSQKLIQGGKKNDEPVNEMRDVVILSDGNENGYNSRESAEFHPVAREVVGDAKRDKRNTEAADEKVEGETGAQEINGGNEYKEGSENDYIVGKGVSNAVFGYLKDIETTNKPVVEAESRNAKPLNEMQEVMIISSINDASGFNSREDQELDRPREVIRDATEHQTEIKTDEKVARESTGTALEKMGDNESRDGSEDVTVKTMEEHSTRSNADVRELDNNECRLHLINERNTSSNLESLEVLAGNEVKEHVDNDNKDVLARSPLGRAPRDTDEVEVTSKSHKKTSSREDNFDDEKIWEIIGAMRAIVGYNAPSEPTCIGELKALYIFTGVEPPPALINGDSELDEANARLKFLMSIVGVK